MYKLLVILSVAATSAYIITSDNAPKNVDEEEANEIMSYLNNLTTPTLLKIENVHENVLDNMKNIEQNIENHIPENDDEDNFFKLEIFGNRILNTKDSENKYSIYNQISNIQEQVANFTKLKEENYNLKIRIISLYTLLNDLQYYFLLIFILTILCKIHSCKNKRKVKHIRIVENEPLTNEEALKI
tara:strand:- start:663 stop:1220 length:558 start_codon:yes stop_codon:yes gene_type:complete